jgi:hypothetical protein
MNAVILFNSTGSEVARKQPPSSNPMDFTSVNYGGYSVDVYCWDMLAAGISFTHNSSLSTITLPANPKRPLTVTAFYSDGTTRLPGATVYLDSWNGQFSSWTQRASATTDSSGMASFSAWPTTQTGEKYQIRVNNGGGQVGLRDSVSVANVPLGSSYSITTSVTPPISSGTINLTVNSSSGGTLAASEMNAVILFASTGSDVVRKQPPSSNPMDFTSVSYGSYFVGVYCWDMLAAQSGTFSHNASTTYVTAQTNPKRPLTVTVFYSDGTTRLPGATVYLDSWNGQLSSWTQRASATTDSNGMTSFSAWPTTQTGEKYQIRVNSGGGQVGLRDSISVANVPLGSSYSITTSVTPPIQYGNISVRLKKVDGTDAPVSAGTPHFKLYASPLQEFSGANPKTLSNIPVGTYLLEGFQTGTFWGEEFWNSQQVTVAAGSTVNAVLTRQYPYATNVVMKNVETGATISPGQTIAAGTQVRFEVTVRNDVPGTSLNTRVHFVADLGQNAPFDYDLGTSGAQTITGSGGTATFSFTTAFVAYQTGQFYYALEVVTDVEGNPVRTDSWTWTLACGTGRISTISGLIAPPDVDPDRGWTPTLAFIQLYPAGTAARIDPNLRTWIVIHGRRGASTNPWVTNLAGVIKSTYPNDQVLLLDWSDGAYARDFPEVLISETFQEDWIKPTAAWAAGKLVDYGFAGSDLNLIGHSWGGNMSAELAELIPYIRSHTVDFVNSIVALDPARDGAGVYYNPDSLTADGGLPEIDFARNSRFSWAFHSSDLGSGTTPATAHEAFGVDTGGGLGDAHGWVHDVFINMLTNLNQVSQRFTLARLLDQSTGSRTLGPWDPDRYQHSFDINPGPRCYEAILATTVGGQTPYSLTYYNKTNGLEVTEYAVVDTTPPTVTINQASGQSDPTGSSPINFTVVFSEAVTGFASGNVALGGTAGATGKSVTGSGTTYNVAVSGMTQSGTVTATIPAGAAQDGAGNPSLASTSSDNSVTYNAPDTTPPTVTINQAAGQSDPTSNSPINFTVVFSEAVTGFASSDVTLGGTAGATGKSVTGSGTTYNVAVSGMTQSGTVTATIPDGAAQDGAGNSSLASTSSDNSVTYNAPDTTPPTVTINQAASQSDPTGNSPINFTVVFSEAVTGFASGDVTLGGTAGATGKNVTGSGTTYNVAVSGMTQSGTVTATIPAGAAQDGAGNPSLASTSTDNSVTYSAPDITPPTVTINQAVGQSDPTGNSTINFTVVFSEAVTGFGSSGVTLGGTAGATGKNVTGSGTTYNVAVSGMTQSGTVIATIPAGAAQDGAANASLASTSSDNSVTYNVPPQTGSMQVSLAPAGAVSAGAQWQVDGGAWQNSVATVSGLSIGSHPVVFKTVSGWTTPGNQNVTVNANQTTPATGTYVAIPETPKQLTGMTLSNGVIRFVLNGPVGSNYVIQVSSDLVNWLPLSTNTIPAIGWVLITDPSIANQSRRFYRAGSFAAFTANLPTLSVTLLGSNLLLSWPTNFTEFTLETATNLPPTSWTSNSLSPAIVNGQYTVTNAITGGKKFYRLKK